MATEPVASDAPRAITATVNEISQSRYDTANIWKAVEALHQDGFVVLKGVVDAAHIKQLNECMSEEATWLVKKNVKPFNQGVNSNILQGPPVLDAELLFNDIFFNPFVIQLMNAYLGEKPIWNFLTGNNALPKTNGMRQPVHKDMTFFHPQAPFFCIANVPLVPFSPATGSTEFWLGSHAHTSGADQVIAAPGDVLANARLVAGDPTCNVRPEIVEERRRMRPPIQPVCDVGDVMIRDLRTWHAGMPNESDQYRIMLALGYQARWYPNHTQSLKLPLSRANFFMAHGDQPVETRAELLPDDSNFGMLNDNFTLRPRQCQTE